MALRHLHNVRAVRLTSEADKYLSLFEEPAQLNTDKIPASQASVMPVDRPMKRDDQLGKRSQRDDIHNSQLEYLLEEEGSPTGA